MSDNKKFHLAVWAAWLVLHGYLLCSRFSLSALAVVALAALFLLLSTWKNSKYEDRCLSGTLGHVLGCSLFVQLGWQFTEKILARLMLNEEWFPVFCEQSGQKAVNLVVHLFRDDSMMIALVAAVVLYVIRLCTGTKPRVSMLFSYASSAALMYPILDRLYRSHLAALLYTVVMLVFIWTELWNIAVEEERNKCAKRWFDTLTVLLLFVLSWDWYMLRPLFRPGALETVFVLGAIRWKHLLAAGAVLAGLFVAAATVGATDEEAWADVKILTAAVFMLLLTAFLKWFPIGWWWILVLADVLYLFADVLVIHPKLSDDEDALMGSWFCQIGVGVISILTAVTGHFGTWPMLLALGVAVLVAALGIGILLDREDERLYLPGGVLTAVLAILIPAVTWLWMYRRLAYFFHVLLLLAAAVLVIAGLLSWNVTKDDRKNILAPLCAGVVFLVLVLDLSMAGGSRITMELDERGIPVVTAEARGEEAQVVNVEYRWTEDWLDLDAGTFRFHREEEVTSPKRLAGREGKLRVVATDSRGIITETIFWMHRQPQSPLG